MSVTVELDEQTAAVVRELAAGEQRSASDHKRASPDQAAIASTAGCAAALRYT
jgi:hypothetical protein